MAWNRLMLTTVGKTLYAKAQQGKQLTFTRVAIGDGDLGTGSLVNRTALISEKKSLLIDAIQIVNETESAIITTLSNADITAGFYFREIGIFAKDPDTQIEQLYLYDNAGADGEYIPDNQSGITVAERLKFLLMLENVTSVSFVASGNPIYLTPEDIDDDATATGTLWSSSKTKAEIDALNSSKQDKIIASGLLKSAGTGIVSAAIKGTDYAGAVNGNTAMTDLADADYIPLYDTSAAAEKKTLWSTIKSTLKAYFDGLYAALIHTHTKSQITDFPALGTAAAKDVPASGNAGTTQVVMGSDTRLSDSRPASDVSAWAKAAAKPSYTATEVGADASGAATAAVSAHNNAADAHSALFASIRKVGDIVATTCTDLGEKYLLCNGDTISESVYPELYAKTRVYGIDTDFPSVYTSSYAYANAGVVEYNGYLIKFNADPSGGIKLYYVALGGTTWTTVSIPYPNNLSTVTSVFDLEVVNGVLCFLVYGGYTYIAFSTDITTWKYMRVSGTNPTSPRLIYAFNKYVMLYTSSSSLYLYYSCTLVEDITNFWSSSSTGKPMSAIGDVCFDGTTLMVADQGTNTTLHCYYTTSVPGAFSQVPVSLDYFSIIAIYRIASCWLLVSKRNSSFQILTISDLTVAPLVFLLNTDTTTALSLFIDNILILIQGGTYYYLDTTNFSPDNGITALTTWAYGSMAGFDAKYTSHIPGNSIVTGQVGSSATYTIAMFERALPTISNLGVYTYIKAKE